MPPATTDTPATAMDLSNLSSNLPLSSHPTEESINTINKELSDEFKTGARSIAALYRLSNTKNSLLIAKGYLDCLNDLSTLLENGKVTSISDLKHFVADKKSELSPPPEKKSENFAQSQANQEPSSPANTNTNTDTVTIASSSAPLSISSSYKFTVNNPTSHHFPPARTPLSIDHSNLKYYVEKPIGRSAKNHTITSTSHVDDTINTDDEEVEFAEDLNDQSSDISVDSSDYGAMKRRLRDSMTAVHKKQKQ